jgi:predicted nucleic acid-binding protein
MPKLRLLLVDACVLIDFAKSDTSVITLASRYVGEVHVATPVFEEVQDLDPAMAASLGIKLYEPPLEMLAAAAAKRGRLSFQDRLCLQIAKANGWTCVSNDRRLRESCEEESVAVMWGFELIALLVEHKALSPIAARDIAKSIAASNKRIGRQVLVRFLARIRVKE